jgi:hypothetical protein
MLAKLSLDSKVIRLRKNAANHSAINMPVADVDQGRDAAMAITSQSAT